jgi:Dolichyl-phosphate-mannose-protein mannosyltransferase
MSSTNAISSITLDRNDTRPWWLVPALISLIYFSLHLFTATRYGYFRDALYYLACAEHLDWGYVDHPPLIVLVAWIVRHTLGTSLPALLMWPALAGCARIVLTAAFAHELGARSFGTALAAALASTPGVWWAIDHQFAMNAFEPALWTGCAYVLLRLIKTENPRVWLAFGCIAGIGLQNKYSIAVFAFALLVGLLLTPQRKLLFTPWLFAGGGIALLIFLPNLLWNIQHHWPFFELMRNIRASGRDVALAPPEFIAQQILLMMPLSLPFWVAGLLYYFFSDKARSYRAFGWAFVITIGFFMIAHGKNYYSAPTYPIVLASGAVAAELFLTNVRFATKPRLRTALQTASFVWLVAGVLFFLPVVLPILPVGTYLRYQEHLPFAIPRSENVHMGVVLPQHYADEFGWPEIVAEVARVYNSLPPEERAKTAIYANNYGEAGAIDLFGAQYGLPKAICPNQSYFLWGPRNYTGEIMIVIGAARVEDAKRHFESVEPVGQVNSPYPLLIERHPILLCRGLKPNLQAAWPQLKDWD